MRLGAVVSCVPLLGLCWACQAGGASSSSSSTDVGTDTGALDDGHGSVRISIEPQGGDTSIFDGTTTVVATVHYETCLQDFYLRNDPSMQQQGPEGAPVFADWMDRLCSEFSSVPSCTITEIEQTLLEATDLFTLSITYAIDDPATLAYAELHVGPLPTELLAACSDGQRPTVELRPNGLLGLDAQGDQLWYIATLAAQNSAFTDQGVPLRVEVARLSP